MPFSYLAAFLGGLISLLSPCSALVLPGFLANSFGQKKRLWLATALFALGVLTVTLSLGLGITAVAGFLADYRRIITLVVGAVLIIEALFQFSGRSLFYWRYRASGAYALGIASAIGAVSCVGPILGAIITLALNQSRPLSVWGLILSYSLGLTAPLFLVALGFKNLRVRLPHWLIAGFLLILGIIFIKNQGSLRFGLDFFFDLQDKLFKLK